MMKIYSVRLTFTDRKLGPGCGSTIRTTGSNPHTGIKKATRMFWDSLNSKQRRDVRRDGLKVELREVPIAKTEKA
jgi:hypothetical protein